MRVDVSYNSNGKVTAVPIQNVVPEELVDEIIKAIKSVKGYGSIEIYVQDHSVTQITIRNIKKTKHILSQ